MCLGVVEGVEAGVVEAVGVGGHVDGDLEVDEVSRKEAVRTGDVCREARGLWDRCSSRDLHR